MKVTIYDIAREANVSIATVSKVINDKGRIGVKTREKVLHVMKELNYQPSTVASALTGKATFSLGLLIPDLANPFFSELARNVENCGHELGYSIMMCSTDYNPEKELKYISLLKQKKVDGIILASGFQNDDVIRQLITSEIPTAVVARDVATVSVDTVTIDDFLGGYEAANHLIQIGHTKLSTVQLQLESGDERIRGYRQAMLENNLPIDENTILYSGPSVEAAKEVGLQLLSTTERPTAVTSGSDILALGIIQAAREFGLAVPNDLSVVGYDNTVIARISDPPLTTISQPIEEMAQQVMELLIQGIKNEKKKKRRIVLMPELVIRGSTSNLNSLEKDQT